MLGPVREELVKDEAFTLSTAKSVTSRIRKDQTSTLQTLAESELDISPNNVPKLSGDLTSEQVNEIDKVLSAEFGEEWFKNRKSFPTAISTNHSLMSSICTVFYVKSAPMLELVEKEVSRTCPQTSKGGIVVDGSMMREFLNSAELVRTEAWKHVGSFYNKARERMQRNNRAKRHRQKLKSATVVVEGSFDAERSDGRKRSSDDSDSESESSESSKASKRSDQSLSRNVVPKHGSRDRSKLEPLKSVQECVENLLEVVGFLNSNERSKDKYKRLSMLFDEHSTKLEQRVATIVDRNEAQICTSLAILTLIHSILPEEMADACVSRLTLVTEEFSIQGVFPAGPPRTLDSSIRSRIELMLKKQIEVVQGVLNRLIPKVSDSDAKLTKSESKSVQGLAVDLSGVFKDLEGCFNNGDLNREEVSWILTCFCHYHVRACVVLWATPKSSSFIRAGQLVTSVSGLKFFIYYFTL